MGNSLQDQLLKAGLADQKKLREVKQQKRKKAKQPQNTKAQSDEAQQQAEQAVAEKQARDRELNQQKQAEAKAKEVTAQIKQIIEQNKVKLDEGDVAYHFTHGSVVKKLYVTAKTQSQLVQGNLAIAAYADGYALVPANVVEKIQQRDPNWFVLCNKSSEETAAEDDPYAQYTVPDDLMW